MCELSSSKPADVVPVTGMRSPRSSGLLNADLAALAYSGGGSLVSAGINVSLLGVERAKFCSFLFLPLDLPPPLHTLVICPCLLHFAHVTSSRLILQLSLRIEQ